MPELRAAVDAETLAVTYLLTKAPVTDLVGAAGVGGKLPRDWKPGEPFVRLVRIGGTPNPNDSARYLDRARIQIEAYGSDEPNAFAILAATLVALFELPSDAFSYSGAVVTAVGQDLGSTNSPDPDTDAPRYLAGAVLYVHPAAP